MNIRQAGRMCWNELSTRQQNHGAVSAVQWAGWHFGWEIPRKIRGVSGFDGVNVYEKDWDLLILLDAMRTDLLDEVISRTEVGKWLGDRTEIKTVSGKSSGWMERTFTAAPEAELAQTAYITGNPHTEWLVENTSVEAEDFGRFEELWRWAWDEEQGTVLPRPLTDRGIAAGRDGGFERIIVHYMQPHFPSIPKPVGSEISLSDPSWSESAWEQLKDGRIDFETVWSSYRANLLYVLQDVKVLFENIDADVAVVSSDHGNAIGERGYFGHNDWPVEKIRTVPWCETSAEDTGTYTPSIEPPAENTDGDVASRLEALGYR